MHLKLHFKNRPIKIENIILMLYFTILLFFLYFCSNKCSLGEHETYLKKYYKILLTPNVCVHVIFILNRLVCVSKFKLLLKVQMVSVMFCNCC